MGESFPLTFIFFKMVKTTNQLMDFPLIDLGSMNGFSLQ
jgi:hypothetical protein